MDRYYYTTGIHYYSFEPNAIARGHTWCFLVSFFGVPENFNSWGERAHPSTYR